MAEPYVHNLSIDLSEQFSMFDVECHELDTLVFNISVMNQGIAYNMNNATIIFQAKKPNGVDYIQTNFGITISGSNVTIQCTEELTSSSINSGLCKCEVRLKLNNATNQVTSRWIYLKVIPSVLTISNDTIETSTLTAVNYVYNLVDQLATLRSDLTTEIDEANQSIDTLETDIASANTKISDISTLIADANTTNSTLNSTITTGNALNTTLTTKNTEANANITNLTSQNTNADENIPILTTKNTEANTNISNLTTKNTEANTLNSTLNTTITNANTTKTGLENSITQKISEANNVIVNADALKTDLEATISESQQINTDLIDSTTTANTSKIELQDKIGEANQVRTDLQNFDTDGIVENTNLMLNKMNSNQLLMTFIHTLNCYPFVQLIFVENGFGLGTFGTSPFSANGISDMIRNSVEYTSLNEFKIYVPADYYIGGTQTITKLTDYKYMVTFSGSTKSIMIQMYKM